MAIKKEPSVKSQNSHIPDKCSIIQCELCKLDRVFELPSEIVHACTTGKLIIFAGSGISTETRGVYPTTFYQNIKDELRIPKKQNISFSKLMSLYCSHPRSRKDLLLTIKSRIDYVKTFPELYGRATEFHRQISTIPHIHEIFTTNWDDFFERECDATPVVTSEDYAVFQDIPGRRVFKLHGSIYNYGSIVATEEDYKRCYHRLNTKILGATLKIHLLSKTMVFVGFSFDDEDFKRIYHLLKKEVKEIIPRLYVITLDDKAKEKLREMKIDAFPIITSATFFIKKLKARLVSEGEMLPEQNFNGITRVLEKVYVEHDKISSLSLLKHPDALYSLAYQDGLIHAFEHILGNKHTGQYSDPERMHRVIESYDFIIKQCLHIGNYPDVAYFTGYLTGQLYLLFNKNQQKSIPLYYLFGCDDIMSYRRFLQLEKNALKYHKSAHKLAVKMTTKIKSDNIVFHRIPFL